MEILIIQSYYLKIGHQMILLFQGTSILVTYFLYVRLFGLCSIAPILSIYMKEKVKRIINDTSIEKKITVLLVFQIA